MGKGSVEQGSREEDFSLFQFYKPESQWVICLGEVVGLN